VVRDTTNYRFQHKQHRDQRKQYTPGLIQFNLITHGSQVKLYPNTVAHCTLRHRLKYIIGSTIIATMSSSDYSRMPDRGYMCALSRGATQAALVWLFTIPHFLFSSSGSRPGWEDFNPDLKFRDVPGILPTKFLLDSIHFLEWIFLLGYVMAL
jgi:hypothetical protein